MSIMKHVWMTLKKPIFILAPMENVTDTVFRQIIASCGKPDLFFTEFTNTDGMFSMGKEKVIERLKFSNAERPIIAQIWGNNPKNYIKASKIIQQMGFDGIDINMGCPDKSIVKKGCCAGLMNNPNLAKEIILAAKEGAGQLPVSVKTRIGYSKIQTEEWIGFLLGQNLDAITIHGRTKKEMSKAKAHWDEIGKAVILRNTMKKNTLIIGNGDVKSYEDALCKQQEYGVDGVMIGRGIFNNLWIFNPSVDPTRLSIRDKLKLLIDHLELFDKTWGSKKPFDGMKKFYKVYTSAMPNASEFRLKLMGFKTPKETINYIKSKIDIL